MQNTQTRPLLSIAFLAIFTVFITIVINSQFVHAAQPTVNLRTASPFAIIAGTPNITDAGNASVINGNVGLSPATGAGIGLVCSQVTGTIYSVDSTGPLPCRVNDAPLLLTAKNNLTTAYNDAAGRTPVTTVPTELGGTTLVAGVYDSSSTTFGITAGAGALVLDGQGDSSSVFIFQAPFSGTGLNVGSGSTVSLINGAQACNIFWRVDTAAIDTTATFVGTILALNSITVANGATINGRLLARNGNVTLINDTITVSICAGNDTADVTPGLPNTGERNIQYLLWIAVSTLLVAIGSLFAYVVYKKQSS
ncbi:MAG: ice-binding family protein [Candidatus Microsaccharimonas sp.]